MRVWLCKTTDSVSLYIDDLMELAESGVGCHWDGLFVGALAYADNLTLLAPSPPVLRMLLHISERFSVANYLKFNPEKHNASDFPDYMIVARVILCFVEKLECCRSVTHQGHTLKHC